MDDEGYEYKEAFSPKLEIWKPKEFTQACVSDIDRNMKVKSERAKGSEFIISFPCDRNLTSLA